MLKILNAIGFSYICQVKECINEKGSNDYSSLDALEMREGVYLFIEDGTVILIGKSKNLKHRISQCIRSGKDSGAIINTRKLSEKEYQHIINSSIYVLLKDNFIDQASFYFNDAF